MHREAEEGETDELASGPDADGRHDDGGGDADDHRLAAGIEPHVQQTYQAPEEREGDIRQDAHADRVQECHVRAVLTTFRLSSFIAAS